MPEYTFQVFEDITSDTIKRIAGFLREIPDKSNVTMEICSYGGSVFDGFAVLQMIQMSQKFGSYWTAKVYGLAASTAADIVMVCNRIEMASTSSIMIHSAWNEDGSHDDGIRIANNAQLAVIHNRLPNYSSKDLQADRWFTAKEALEVGLVDSIFDDDVSSSASRIAAKYLSHYNGGLTMDEEIKKEEVVEEKAEEVEEVKEEEIKEESDDKPSMEDLLERLADRISELDDRLRKLEEIGAKAECGDPSERRENGRLKAIYDKIAKVTAPACKKKTAVFMKSPKEELAECKAKYPNLDAYINKD